eukprot:scaffold1828_cov169-Amphora_coffeaeformis.AAC.17
MWQSSSAILSSQIEALRAAERRLIELSSRFDRSISSSSIDIIPFDTQIPRSVVPLKYHTCGVYSNSNNKETDDNHYQIHALRISNNGVGNNSTAASSKKDQAPLVMLHGYMNGAAYFYRNFPGLSRHFKSIYSLDLLGWGLSSRPKFALIDDKVKTAEDFFVESLEAWRSKNEIEKMILAGHSMGGYVSVAYCGELFIALA